MAFYSIFKKAEPKDLKKIDILKLRPSDECFYEKFKEPFKVTEVATTNRGVFYVEIRHPKTSRTFVFTDYYPVMVRSDLYQNRI